ncbi:MAG: putative bifunctional diguanylate cyclase/phosphodiesterase [Microthrixaceae bacterium]
MNDVPWSLHQLAEVLAAFSIDDPDAVRSAVDRVAEAVDAEVALLIDGGRVGYAIGVTPQERAELSGSAATRPTVCRLRAGEVHLSWSPLGEDGLLVIGRADEPFDLEERSMLRAMARSIDLGAQVVAAVRSERRARGALDSALDAAVHQATHDDLTGLPNRATVIEELARRLSTRDPSAAVLFVDVDRFKQVNDAHGHAAGDRYLAEVARRLRGAVRDGDLVGRLAGDEFIVVSDRTGPGQAERLADRLLAVMARPMDLEGRLLVPSASVGIAVWPTAGPDGDPHGRPPAADSLVDDADLAMYRAKQQGRGRAARFEPSLREAARRRVEVEVELSRALAGDELEVWFQPVVRLADREVMGLEALVRWRHPVRGLLQPDEFVPVAEETGQVVAIDDHVLRRSCELVAAWNAERPGAPLSLSTNVSARSFADPTLPHRVAAALDHSGLPARDLFLEITESVMMEESIAETATMEQLVDLGVRLAVDDFGTGYSSLRYLKRFPVGVLKVDRSFTEGLGVDRENEAIVRAVVGLARSLRLATTAEGVESEEHVERLRDLGCEYGQGFLFGRPADAATTARLWRADSSEPAR